MRSPQEILVEFIRFARFDQLEDAAILLRPTMSEGREPWKELMGYAAQQRLTGYLAAAVSKDPSFAFRAADIILGMKAQCAHHALIIEQIFNATDGLDVRLVKGLAVSSGAHTRPHLRPCGDIDLLVHPRHFVRVVEKIMELGFLSSPSSSFPHPIPRWLSKNGLPRNVDAEAVLHRDGIIVELHPNLLSPKLHHSIDVDRLFDDPLLLSSSPFAREIPTLKPTHFWIHLAINHNLHRFAGGLGALLDLAKWCDRFQLDPAELARQTDEWNLGYLIAPVEKQLRGAFQEPLHASSLESLALIWNPVRDPPTPWHWIRQSPKPYLTLWRNLFPSKWSAAVRYNRSPGDLRLYVRRIFRPFELLIRHARTTARERLS